MCKFNALPIAPRQLMLQKAQHCAPKRERIYPLQFIEGVYGNSVRAEKSLRNLPEKKVLKFSRNAFQKNTPPVSSKRGSKFTIRIWLRSVASRKTVEFRSATRVLMTRSKLSRKNGCTVLATRREQLKFSQPGK